jgi:hypothetical protein
MRRIVVKGKDGKKRLVNVPSWDREVVNNQINQPAYDISLSSTSGSAVSGSTTTYIEWQNDTFTWDTEIRNWENVYIVT